ncbi:uncharacterized protein B0H18DRAFT_1041888, partial [Fomitopsis serialis]|uniref:uncharacterized protein n=1 Tax=Fomitopsis serialis TaxID=139415 RepID=UPI0020081937
MRKQKPQCRIVIYALRAPPLLFCAQAHACINTRHAVRNDSDSSCSNAGLAFETHRSTPLCAPCHRKDILHPHNSGIMDAFFDIAIPVPAEEEQVPVNYDTGSGSGSGSCTIA